MAALADFTTATLSELFTAWGHNPSHAGRVLRAVYAGGDWDVLHRQRLPARLMDRLRIEFAPGAAELAARQVAADGTTKLLLRLGDGRTVESVLMQIGRAHV